MTHPTGHSLSQPQNQAQGLAFKNLATLYYMAAQRFIALNPTDRRGGGQDHVGAWRPLFASDLEAFSIVRGCSFTLKRWRTRRASSRPARPGSAAINSRRYPRTSVV